MALGREIKSSPASFLLGYSWATVRLPYLNWQVVGVAKFSGKYIIECSIVFVSRNVPCAVGGGALGAVEVVAVKAGMRVEEQLQQPAKLVHLAQRVVLVGQLLDELRVVALAREAELADEDVACLYL